MLRKEILETLDLLKPALAEDNMIPIFTNYCFDDDKVHAYRDSLGIVAPCAIGGLTFGVPGKVFGELLRSSKAQEITFQLDNNELLTRAGKTKIKLPFFNKSEFLFQEPEEDWDIIFDLNADFLNGLRLCMITSSVDATMPALMGVSIKGTDDAVALYSSDGDALSRFFFKAQTDSREQYIIPNEFCDALLRITEKTDTKEGQLYVNGNWVVAELANNYRIFGRIIENPEPFDFEAEINRVMKGTPTFVPVPTKLLAALGRACIVADPVNKPTNFTIKSGKLIILTETQIGTVRDVFLLKGHPDIKVDVAAKALMKIIPVCEEMALLDNVTLYTKGDLFQLVANYEE